MSKRGLHQRRLLGGMAFGKAGRGPGARTASRIFRPVRPLSRALLRNSLFKTLLDQRSDNEPGAVLAPLFPRPAYRLQVSHPLAAEHQRHAREGIELMHTPDGGRRVATR